MCWLRVVSFAFTNVVMEKNNINYFQTLILSQLDFYHYKVFYLNFNKFLLELFILSVRVAFLFSYARYLCFSSGLRFK